MSTNQYLVVPENRFMLPLEVVKVGTKPLTDLTFNHRVVMHPVSDLKYRLRLISHHILFKILKRITSVFNEFNARYI